ncbi:hypothetical protein [Gracilimonas sediminicola]|uniref:Uncharacterized protein n=1 Tax=Gracilimonas sediminicola TaxID=2952158 RepID=A0A9X2RH16_9BACT|nr:hypothetical protein [Gracilimonas sediminicola]MCP9291913.1 hypothetical protein [Gracilimonas sediminicola]
MHTGIHLTTTTIFPPVTIASSKQEKRFSPSTYTNIRDAVNDSLKYRNPNIPSHQLPISNHRFQ